MGEGVSILVCGRDVVLLDSRKWLLEASGYRVCAAMELAKAAEILAVERIALVVLCHSLSLQDRGQLTAMCREHVPPVKCLSLVTSTGIAEQPAGYVASTARGPAALVRQVQVVVSAESSVHSHVY